MAINVKDMDCDFFAFSGHKTYGPTGIGVLYGKEKWLEQMPPYMGGGDMIKTVSFEHTTFNVLPYKFEAGTPDYVASTGLAKALEYLMDIGMDNIEKHERELTLYAINKMQEIEGMHIFGPIGEHVHEHDAVISFEVKPLGATPHTPYIHHLDMGTLLDRLGIAVRTGHHCAEPLMRRLGVEGTCRASFGLYNTKEEIDTLVQGIKRVQSMF
jgi:cysteine desulfurase/selenocysteine lyase